MQITSFNLINYDIKKNNYDIFQALFLCCNV